MEFILELIFQLIGEIFFQILAELPFEWLRFKKKENPQLFSFSLSMFLGIIAGIISLFILKEHLIANMTLRIINVIIGPVLIGKLFVFLHGKRNYREDKLYLFSSFWSAYIFALSIAVIRFFFV